MPDANDMDLVREFARTNSEVAFTELVRRYINLVYSVARRCTGTDGDAQDVTQAVFIILARKASGLHEKTLLTGWLYETTRFTAARLLRSNARRHAREQEAYMQSAFNEADPAAVWEKLSPHLEAAMSKLVERDRVLLVLRFYENKSGPEAAALLGIREDAAHKRLARALEKLRKVFAHRGLTLTAMAIAGAVSANSVQAAPVGLVKTISAVGLAKGAAATASTLTLVKETIKIMARAKLKLAIGITAGALLAVCATTMIISQTTSHEKWATQEIARQSQEAYAALSSYSDTGTVNVEGIGDNPSKMVFNIRLARPNLYRINWARAEAKAGLDVMTGTAWSDGSGNHVEAGLSGKLKKDDMRSALALGAFVSGNSSINVPGTFFKQTWGDILSLTADGKVETKKEKDERIGGVDCHVISRVVDAAKLDADGKLPNMGNAGMATSTDVIWIGKNDHLIHQIRSSLDYSSVTNQPQLSDEMIKKALILAKKPVTSETIAGMRKAYGKAAKSQLHDLIESGKIVFTETHENISVNEKFSPSDFAR